MKLIKLALIRVLLGCLIIINFTSMASAELPNPGMQVDERTAIVVTDPQNDFLSPKGVTWGVVGKSVTENNTVENIETLFKVAKNNNIPVFVSPHYYYPTDKDWKFEGALEVLMHKIGMFDRKGPLNLEGFKGSGADWLDRYKPYIENGKTIVVNPHKVYGPEANDLILQLRKRGIDKVILAGMSANLCTESHMRELVEQGFEVAVVKDATAAAIVPEGNGYEAALVNFRFIASAVWTTDETVEAIAKYKAVSPVTAHKTVEVNGLDIFYREAGPENAPTILLLHGYPTSSHMFRNLIRDLSDQYHLLAPDYPGFGRSEQPPMSEFDYTFDNMSKIVIGFLEALKVEKFSIYLMDYGAPIGFRIAAKYPERVDALIVQNGNAYEEGLKEFWDPIKKYWNDKTVENGKALEGFHSPEGLKWQYTHGVRDVEKISPDNWHVDLQHLSRPENNEIQLAMFYDYRTNVPLYPEWQAYFREYQPPTLIVWGKNDHIFPADGAHPYKRDLKGLEFHLLDTGHFALEEDGHVIANHIRDFLGKKVK